MGRPFLNEIGEIKYSRKKLGCVSSPSKPQTPTGSAVRGGAVLAGWCGFRRGDAGKTVEMGGWNAHVRGAGFEIPS